MKTYKEMGLPQIGTLQSFWNWWLEYKRLIIEGKLAGIYCKNFWINKNIEEFDLFMRWMLDLINKEHIRSKRNEEKK